MILMNKTLFIANMKSNWGVFVFIAGMLLVYVVTSVSMFDPESAGAMKAMFDMLPECMMKAFGFDGLGTELTGYLAHYLYGFIFVVFPMIYTIVLSNKLVAKHVDSGSMAYLLTTPNSRIQIIRTQALYIVISMLVLLSFDVAVLIATSEMIQPGLLDICPFLALNLVPYLIIVFVASISFLCSSIFNETKYSIGFGAGIPVIFFVLKMVSEISEKLDVFKYFTVYSLLDPDRILTDNAYTTILSLILVGASFLVFSLSIIIFNKRSLAI